MAEFKINYPGPDGNQVVQNIASGQFLFLVGANGTGKSALMHHFSGQNRGHFLRITAHRQVWFNSDFVDLSPMRRQQTEERILFMDTQAQSRWKDDQASERTQAVIFDIVDLENVNARKIADAACDNDIDTVKRLAKAQSPLKKLNDILKVANLDYQLSISEGGKLVALREGYEPYSIAELSDGERNALLIAANVLTASHDSLILLDEPERHLHRSIVSPLLSTLLTYRDDCAFVISTHDVLLPLDQEKADALLLRSYVHTPKQHWVADRIEAIQNMDEEMATAILGSRKKLLFIEGKALSLDLQLYHLVFPDISTHPVGSCVEVERIVRGLRAAEDMHWATAIGIIDRDQRSDEECLDLLNQGIAALPQYSVESIYYHPKIIELILSRISDTHGIDPNVAREDYLTNTIAIVQEHRDRLAARIAEKLIRDRTLKNLPDWRNILKQEVEVKISTADILATECKLIQQLIETNDVERIISRYPIRETPIPNKIARALGFQTSSKYELSVRKALIDSEEAREIVRRLMRPVVELVQA